MPSIVQSHHLPNLEVRAPELLGQTVRPLVDRTAAEAFRNWLIQPSGVGEPTVIAVNLEGRFPSATVLKEIVVPLGRIARSGSSGPLTVVICTREEGTRDVVRALAQTYDLALFWAPSAEELSEAEPLGPMTVTDSETLEIVSRLGGRVTVSGFADAASLEANAASNRLMSVVQKGFIHRVERPRRHGILFVDPRAATPTEDPADPTSGDFLVSHPLRRDIRALSEMQSREQGNVLANAWQELLVTHKDELSREHSTLAEAMKRDDHTELSKVAQRYTKKKVESQPPKRKS